MKVRVKCIYPLIEHFIKGKIYEMDKEIVHDEIVYTGKGETSTVFRVASIFFTEVDEKTKPKDSFKSFKQLPRNEATEIFMAWIEGKPVEKYNHITGKWYSSDLDLNKEYTYRLKPISDSIDWSHVNPIYKYMARNSSGNSFLFEEKPKFTSKDNAWKTSSGFINTNYFASYKEGNVSPKDSLIERPSDV